MSRDDPCSARVRPHWKDRKADLEVFMENTEGNEDLGPFYEYGLSFDYVAPGTFTRQRRGYWRYQISWGGPSDEIRFYGDHRGRSPILDRAEYWFLDWYDGAKIIVTNQPCVQWLWNWFADVDSLKAEYDKAMED